MSTIRTLKGLAGMVWPGTRTNSQYGEDVFVGRFFKDKASGTWLDIGAFHPRVASNTERLRRRGWTGINVDADPAKVRMFEWFRRSDVNVCAAVAGPAAGRAVLRTGAATYGSMDRLEMTTSDDGLETRTVDDILAEAGLEHLDFVSIDVEGLEADILEAFPFDRYMPELLCVEILDTTLDGVTGSPVTELLARHGYRVVGWFPPSVFFAHRPLTVGHG
ncbi:MAG: FkbM family methyltransferase [Actinomycetota bacterium]|nr:FkbM family methyltransferase [Actinomycetota bacterium]